MESMVEERTWRHIDSLPEVRELLELGVPMTRIAKRFGVSRQAIYDAFKSEAKRAEADTPAPTTSSPVAAIAQEDCSTSGATPERNGQPKGV